MQDSSRVQSNMFRCQFVGGFEEARQRLIGLHFKVQMIKKKMSPSERGDKGHMPCDYTSLVQPVNWTLCSSGPPWLLEFPLTALEWTRKWMDIYLHRSSLSGAQRFPVSTKRKSHTAWSEEHNISPLQPGLQNQKTKGWWMRWSLYSFCLKPGTVKKGRAPAHDKSQ